MIRLVGNTIGLVVRDIASLIGNVRYLGKMERIFERVAKEVERRQGGRRYPPSPM